MTFSFYMNSKIASCRTLLKSNWREKTSKVVTQRRPPLQCRSYSQAIVALRSLQYRYLPQCVVRVRELTSLAVVCRQWSLTTTTNEIVTAWKRLETASHGMETSKKWGLRSPTKYERNHNELFCSHQISTCWKFVNERDG